jgi:predicted acylesterase/phospholipase RssA
VLIGLLLIGSALAGCAKQRPAESQAELLQKREVTDARVAVESQQLMAGLLARAEAKQEAYAAGRSPVPPTIDILVISGGGDWGAFGAGFLKGWGRVPAGPMARPQFDAVTGVSTGALIAPFAFVGDEAAIERVNSLYRNPKKDWVKQRGWLYFLPTNESFAKVPGLEREMRSAVDRAMLQRIAAETETGRVLAVNTTNVDDGGMQVWNIVTEAKQATQTGDVDRVHRILLASAGIPGAFPAREIDGALFVDGGVTGNIIYGGRVREEESISALWAKARPNVPAPKLRYWIIFNNQLRPPPQVTAPTWPPIVGRSISIATRSATLTSMRHLHAQADIARLKHGASVEVRVVTIPDDWVPPKAGTFVKETMNALADLGERMGADPSSWRTACP